ncbi:MAG: molybdopterin-dependent oxidoreductase [candidate division KSB1 bacterium]|nr:molybdopterin-dependent oxidoreductase [candidate division KSB1 bacterium]MDZ7312262.1 molybdopterin-dependent oxidoreductase [candidate division KSB1 bacterium]
MPTITIDGKSIEVEKGTTIMQAADKLGIILPRYCYHPGLSIVGQCRICLVEIEKMPKLQVACYTPVTDGMVVHTQSPKAMRGRKDVLEFLLVNHPLDCPVCDQAGECFLQDYYMKIGQYDSKMVEDKNKKHKALDIGPHVMLDSERCILCTRCVRFCNEISKSNELGIFNRGDHAELLPYPGRRLDNPYSVNTVDICPVGALTEKDFRFEARVWYLKQTDSICPGCSTGCNISVHTNTVRDHHAESRRVVRLKPRYNAEVNKWWMCDFGRYSYKPVDEATRITAPMLKHGDNWIATTWQVAIEAIADKIKKALPQKKSGQIGVWASPQMTNEDLFVLRQFTETLGINHIAMTVTPRERPFSDNYLIREDKNPNTRGAIALGYDTDMQASRDLYRLAFDRLLSVLFIFHHDLTLGFEAEHLAAALGNVPTIIFIGPNRNATSEFAHILLPAAAWPEKDGTFTNFAGRVQRMRAAVQPLGDARTEWMILKRLGKPLGLSVPYVEAGDVFAAIGRNVPAFSGLTYESVGSFGVMLKS